MTWRTGRKNGRTIYEQHGTEPSDDDKPIGMMDTAALAAHVVEAVNAWNATDEPGKYEARCECGHPYKEHAYDQRGCEHLTREAGGWRNCVCMNNPRGQNCRDVQAAEYPPPILCPECGHGQDMHLQGRWIGCTKVEYLSSGDWAGSCPCMLTYDQITARLMAEVRPDMEDDLGCACLGSNCSTGCQLRAARVEMVARLAAHGLAEDEPMPASCLLGRCGHDKAEPVTDMGKWFTKEELAGIADDGTNHMERADNLPDEAPKIAGVAARQRRFMCGGCGHDAVSHDRQHGCSRYACDCPITWAEVEAAPKGETFPQAATTTAPSSTSATDSAALSPDMWSAHGEAGLEPKEWFAAIDPAAPEDVVVVELARGGIVQSVPFIAGEPRVPSTVSGDWTPPARMGGFTVPQGIRDLFGPGVPNVKVTVTGPGGEKLGEVIHRALTEGEKSERQAAMGRLAEGLGIGPELADTIGTGHWSSAGGSQTEELTRIAEDALEGVLADVTEFAHKALLDAGIDPTGITVTYDMSPLRPKPIVDVELPTEEADEDDV